MTKTTQLPFIFKVWGLPACTELAEPFVPNVVERGLLLQHWLVHCCLYYKMNQSILTDHEFDELAQDLAFYWNDPSIQMHRHAYLVAIHNGEPQTKSGFYITEFPGVVQGCAQWLLDQYNKSNKPRRQNR